MGTVPTLEPRRLTSATLPPSSLILIQPIQIPVIRLPGQTLLSLLLVSARQPKAASPSVTSSRTVDRPAAIQITSVLIPFSTTAIPQPQRQPRRHLQFATLAKCLTTLQH